MYDSIQVSLMNEMIIEVDGSDQVIGGRSKKDCHLMSNINQGLLHRAFSVFVFNQHNQLLLQQRAQSKITFPECWTNTCCSHPLYLDHELEEKDQLGVKRAGQRRLREELGIDPADVPIEQFKFITRIHYKVSSDETWGEHEIDYILFIKTKHNPTLNVNTNEVKDTIYINREDLANFIETKKSEGGFFSPWFSLLTEKHDGLGLLDKWWKYLNDNNLDAIKDVDNIHVLF